MKRFLTIVGWLTVMATPAFAQSFSSDFGTGNIAMPALQQQEGRADGMSAFAQAPQKHRKHISRQTNVDLYR